MIDLIVLAWIIGVFMGCMLMWYVKWIQKPDVSLKTQARRRRKKVRVITERRAI